MSLCPNTGIPKQFCTCAADHSEGRQVTDSGITHWHGCYMDGPKHYACALAEIERLKGGPHGEREG